MDGDALISRLKRLEPGTQIPKPLSPGGFKVAGWGRRRGEPALVYAVPNRKHPEAPYRKGVTMSEWKAAYIQLLDDGQLTCAWSQRALPACEKEGPCNFTTVGGIFQLPGVAEYAGKGCHSRAGTANQSLRLR